MKLAPKQKSADSQALALAYIYTYIWSGMVELEWNWELGTRNSHSNAKLVRTFCATLALCLSLGRCPCRCTSLRGGRGGDVIYPAPQPLCQSRFVIQNLFSNRFATVLESKGSEGLSLPEFQICL